MPTKVPPTLLCVRLSGPAAVVRQFLVRYPIQPESIQRHGDGVSIEVLISEKLLAELAGTELKVEFRFDATARGLERQKQVRQGNPFEDGKQLFKGLGVLVKE